jgi:hypothetical protein
MEAVGQARGERREHGRRHQAGSPRSDRPSRAAAVEAVHEERHPARPFGDAEERKATSVARRARLRSAARATCTEPLTTVPRLSSSRRRA